MKRKRYPIRYGKPIAMFNPDMVDEIAEVIIKNERRSKMKRKRQGEDEKDSGTKRDTELP